MQKKEEEEVEEENTEAEQNEELISVVKMEVVEEPSTSISSQTFTINENVETTSAVEIVETTAVLDLTERVDVAKNTDLFKAIFLDSESEDEEEKEEQDDINKNETLKTSVLNDSLLPKIKAKKDGILSNLDLSQLAPATSKINLETPDNVVSSTSTSKLSDSLSDDLSYGPKVPQTIVNKSTNSSFVVDESDDDWVEKDSEFKEEKKSSHKHKKKNKKEKHQHKKKHKHDKKKK